MGNQDFSIEVLDSNSLASRDLNKTIFDLNNQIDMLSSHADQLDYFVAIASGILCGMMDVLWVGEFNLARGRDFAQEEVEGLVKKTAKIFGCKKDDLASSVKHLEKMFPLAADGNTPDFGGGLQHHLRDFAHHPTAVGLFFSLLTQFTKHSYGTDTLGKFIVVPVPQKSLVFIGKDPIDKIFKGTIIWFFHLISDIAGSGGTAALSGGTGIPGPILSLAKELSVLPGIRKICIDKKSLSAFLSKMFNGTLFAQHDEAGKIIKGTEIKFDFRGELGVLAELGRQALPVIANECIVRAFYFIRRFASEVKSVKISSLDDFSKLDWDKIKPFKNPTLDRMLLVSSGVFTAVDVADAVVSQKYFISINYVGVGRFTVALGTEMVNALKIRDVVALKNMYEEIRRNTFTATDHGIYERLAKGMNIEKFGLNLEQTEILYNLECLKTINDIGKTNIPIIGDKVISLKQQWVDEWKKFMEAGFPSFVQDETAELHWYSKDEILDRVAALDPSEPWLRLVLLEAMLFEPYYTLSVEKDKEGKEVPSKKYKELQNPINGFRKSAGDDFLDEFFAGNYKTAGCISRYRKTYDKVLRELNEVLKSTLIGVATTAGIAIVAIATAGAFAPAIAVALVGSNFAGLSGAALTSACLAYLGGGAIAAGGLGMAGGTMAIVGGGAVLGIGVGAGVGGTISAASIMGKKDTILQSAKLMVSVREIFLNDEHDLDYSTSVYERYVQSISELEKQLVDKKLKESVANKEDKKILKLEIKNTEESVHAMKIAMKSMNKFNSSFAVGMEA